MQICAVMFDLGGVVLESPFAGIARYEDAAGLPAGLVARLNSTDPDTNAWARYERGEVDADGFCELFEAEAQSRGYRVDGRAVMEALHGEIRPEMLRAITRLREAGLRTAACTNNVAPLDRGDGEVAGMLAHFDVVVESSVEGVRKPEPAFYELALDRLGVEAGDCAFLDDLGVNLKTARALGITTIKVDEAREALAQLEKLTGVDLGM